MFITLVLRNVWRNLRRFAPMMLSIVFIFSLIIMGNAVLNKTIDALYSVYAENISGDLTVSPVSENNFTVFGSDQILVGQYIVPPTILNFPELKEEVASLREVKSSAGLVTSAARVEIGEEKRESTVFGVNFEEYFAAASELRLDAGSPPEPGEPGILVQSGEWSEPIGKSALLVTGSGGNFTMRELPVRGTYSYPVEDRILNSIVLTDADTARALNGHLYGSEEEENITADEQQSLSSDLNGLFGNAEKKSADQSDSTANAGIDPDALLGSARTNNKDRKTSSGNIVSGAWNFLLVKLYNRSDINRVTDRVESLGYNKSNGYLVRDWKSSVGSNAHIAWYLQIFFNTGLLFVSFGAAIIATNSMLLSVLERTQEIGTLRAIGSTRVRVAAMIFLETLIVVFGSALVGVCVGYVGVNIVNYLQIEMDNRYFQLLFGGKPVKGVIDLRTVLMHLSAAFFLTFIAVIYPLKHALGISAVEAMSE